MVAVNVETKFCYNDQTNGIDSCDWRVFYILLVEIYY